MNCLTFALFHWIKNGGKIKCDSNSNNFFPHFYVYDEKNNYIAEYHTEKYLLWWQQLHFKGKKRITPCDGW
jgi:hypothetical protein